MKKRIIKLIAAALLLLILPVSVIGVGASLPSYYGETYYGQLSKMYERLYAVQGPKILVLGGSNVAFGLDSALLEGLLAEQGYEYTVCPFGLYAAVGTSAVLDLSRDALGEGDIVVLAIEPTSDTMTDYFGAGAFWKCAEEAPEMIPALDKDRQAALAGSYVSYLQERMEIRRSGDLPVAQGVYAASSFNERCDLTYDRPGNIMIAGFEPSVTVDFSGIEISGAFAREVRDYCADAGKKGASVVLSFSPVNRSCIEDPSAEAVRSFFQTCSRAFGCPIISDPNCYILDSGWFYDSNFHLNTPGAELRTAMLAGDLLPWLGCYRELEYDIPRMPPSAVTIEIEETDADCFTFTEGPQGAGLLISGLTETGKARTELRIPASRDGLPVQGFAEDALSDALDLETLWIPESVSCLPAGLFRNAHKLTRLMLEHRNAPCDIEAETFHGADQIRIYVPTAAYPMYRDGYGCETNPWIAFLERIHTY